MKKRVWDRRVTSLINFTHFNDLCALVRVHLSQNNRQFHNSGSSTNGCSELKAHDHISIFCSSMMLYDRQIDSK